MENKDQIFQSKQKAIDYALWLMFEKRRNNFRFQVVQVKNYFHVLPETSKIKVDHSKINFEPTYKDMTYSEIEAVAQDRDGLAHWDKIRGMVSTMDGETLRFILAHDIPIEKFIRYELANRGYDENHLWCGFDEAKKVWLK